MRWDPPRASSVDARCHPHRDDSRTLLQCAVQTELAIESVQIMLPGGLEDEDDQVRMM